MSSGRAASGEAIPSSVGLGIAGGLQFRPVPSVRNHGDGRRYDSERAGGAGCTRRPRLAVQDSRRVGVLGIPKGRAENLWSFGPIFLPRGGSLLRDHAGSLFH